MKQALIFLALLAAFGFSANAQGTVALNSVYSGNNHTYTAVTSNSSNATSVNATTTVTGEDLQSFLASPESNLQIISPEPIVYVDISAPWVQGDLPTPNICRLKADKTKFNAAGSYIVSVVTKNYMTTYKILSDPNPNAANNVYVIRINPMTSTPVSNRHLLDDADFNRLAAIASTKKRRIHNLKTKNFGIKLWVSNIYTVGEYIIVDLHARNNTNLPYNISDIRFNLVDKNHVKAHVSQALELTPVYSLYGKDHNMINPGWNNVYIFSKFTFPGEKHLQISMSEGEISGRKLVLNVGYDQILKAKSL